MIDRLVLGERAQCLMTEVGGHDQDGVAEIRRAPLAVRQPPVIERLQQDIEHVGMRLLDLVEQHDLVRLAADLLGQRAAIVVADIAGRRADHPGHRVPLHVLRHVEPGDRVFVVEQELGERFRQLGLADAGRAEEQERAGRTRRVLEPGTGAAHRFRHRAHRLGLADDTLGELLLHVLQALPLGFEHLLDRDAGPARHHRGDVAHADLLALGRGARLGLGEAFFEIGDRRIGQLAGAAPIAVALGAFELRPRLVQLLLQPASLGAARLRGAPGLLHRDLFLLGLGELGFQLVEPLLRGAVGLSAQRLALDLELHDAAADPVQGLGLAVDRDAHPRSGFVCTAATIAASVMRTP